METMSKILRLQKPMAETEVFSLEIALFQRLTVCCISSRNTIQGTNPFGKDFYLNFL